MGGLRDTWKRSRFDLPDIGVELAKKKHIMIGTPLEFDEKFRLYFCSI